MFCPMVSRLSTYVFWGLSSYVPLMGSVPFLVVFTSPFWWTTNVSWSLRFIERHDLLRKQRCVVFRPVKYCPLNVELEFYIVLFWCVTSPRPEVVVNEWRELCLRVHISSEDTDSNKREERLKIPIRNKLVLNSITSFDESYVLKIELLL